MFRTGWHSGFFVSQDRPAQDLRHPDDKRRPQTPTQARQQKRDLAIGSPAPRVPLCPRNRRGRGYLLGVRERLTEGGDCARPPFRLQRLLVLSPLSGGEVFRGGIRRNAWWSFAKGSEGRPGGRAVLGCAYALKVWSERSVPRTKRNVGHHHALRVALSLSLLTQ